MVNRILSALLVLSFVGVCFSYQGQGDTGLNRSKQGKEDLIVLRMAVQIPTPKDEEAVIVFDSGNFVVVRQGQLVTIPGTEKFRSILGEKTSMKFQEKGETSGNNFWIIGKR